jgi:Fe-S-cluster containining protein
MGSELYENLKKSDLYSRVQQKLGIEELFVMGDDNKTCTILHYANKCVFLNRKKICMIHEEMGYAAKPLGCRQFPIILTRTPEGVYAGVTFLCPGVMAEGAEPISIREPEVRRFVSEYNYDEVGADGVMIAGELGTSWEGYKVIEKYLNSQLETEPDVHLALRKNLAAILEVTSERWKEGMNFITPESLTETLEKVNVKPLMDEAFIGLEKQFAMAIISILESVNDGLKRRNTSMLLEGGKIFSRLFRKNIDVEKLNEYMDAHPDTEKDEFFRQYFKHIIWRKNFLLQKPLIHGLAALNFLYVILNWYYYASAFTRNAEKPERKDLEKAFEIVEKAVFHNNPPIISPFVMLFGDSMFEMFVAE